ncbi:hypothetical protein [Natronosalvus rutilus]|uniref:Uncharacterized protein n=1 Tax=Natronosalvus rutilus TaxID=2953753 RepID=A0A9E7SU91_9EURY|nr:hypothetical protein [Natronosalvus rutilus]UTF54519.1 hypothetical protein NGM29_04395 [Natronosalvus rutilus]
MRPSRWRRGGACSRLQSRARWLLVVAFAVVVLAVVALVGCWRVVRARFVADRPFSPLFGGRYVGPDWAARNGLETEPVAGELEDFDVYERPGTDLESGPVDAFDPDDVHPAVRRFYERTSDYDLVYETRWHRGFRLGAWLASFATARLEQLNLPGRSDGRTRRLESRLARVPTSADPRDARVWTRIDPDSGEAVFVATYATHERAVVTYANVAVPLPASNLSTVLRPEQCSLESGAKGVTFTTRGPGDGGLFLVTPFGAIRLPMEQQFRVWPVAGGGQDRLHASHEMWLFGRQFLTIEYVIEARERNSR